MNKKDNMRIHLIDFLKKYSNEDLLGSFLVINLFLPNISSPIKVQYLYTIYEEIFEKLNNEKQINSYSDFISFYSELIKYIPDFYLLEDYIPEQDWGEIKYFFNDNTYKIFYGNDLSNVCDFYYSLEIIHSGINKIYEQEFNRSFNEEFEFTLKIQDFIIDNIPKSKLGNQIEPGKINLPSKKFWESVTKFLNSNNIKDSFDEKLLDLYSFNNVKKITNDEKFHENAFKGGNSNYFFYKM